MYKYLNGTNAFPTVPAFLISMLEVSGITFPDWLEMKLLFYGWVLPKVQRTASCMHITEFHYITEYFISLRNMLHTKIDF